MSSYKTDQRHLHHRGREFHFVSYEGRVADPKRGIEASDATWFLVRAGKRWAAIPQVMDQKPEELDGRLTRWLDENAFPAKTVKA